MIGVRQRWSGSCRAGTRRANPLWVFHVASSTYAHQHLHLLPSHISCPSLPGTMVPLSGTMLHTPHAQCKQSPSWRTCAPRLSTISRLQSCVYLSHVGISFPSIWTTLSCSQRFYSAPVSPCAQSVLASVPEATSHLFLSCPVPSCLPHVPVVQTEPQASPLRHSVTRVERGHNTLSQLLGFLLHPHRSTTYFPRPFSQVLAYEPRYTLLIATIIPRNLSTLSILLLPGHFEKTHFKTAPVASSIYSDSFVPQFHLMPQIVLPMR